MRIVVRVPSYYESGAVAEGRTIGREAEKEFLPRAGAARRRLYKKNKLDASVKAQTLKLLDPSPRDISVRSISIRFTTLPTQTHPFSAVSPLH